MLFSRNMMCDPDLKCGVLRDFDLFVLQWGPPMLLGLTGRTASHSLYAWRTSDYNICGVKKNDFKEDSTFNAASETTRITDKYDTLSTSPFPHPSHLLPTHTGTIYSLSLLSAYLPRAHAQFFLCAFTQKQRVLLMSGGRS